MRQTHARTTQQAQAVATADLLAIGRYQLRQQRAALELRQQRESEAERELLLRMDSISALWRRSQRTLKYTSFPSCDLILRLRALGSLGG